MSSCGWDSYSGMPDFMIVCNGRSAMMHCSPVLIMLDDIIKQAIGRVEEYLNIYKLEQILMQFHSICFVSWTGCIKNTWSCRQFWSTRQKDFKNLGLESCVQDWINELNFSKIRIFYEAGFLKLAFPQASVQSKGFHLLHLCLSFLACSFVIPLLQEIIHASLTDAKRSYKQGKHSLKVQSRFYLLVPNMQKLELEFSGLLD